jgi:NADH dehydrogenase FAD-containing subunit
MKKMRSSQRGWVRYEDHKDVALGYDILVIATGVTHSYFGHDEFAEFAPGLKGLADAVRIRNKVLKAFEQAEAEDDQSRRQDFLTFVLVGAGPTGVELASSLAVLVRTKLKAEFRRINLAATTHRPGRHGAPGLRDFRFGALRGGQTPVGKSWCRSALRAQR